MKSFEEPIDFFEDKKFEQSNQLYKKDASSRGYQERAVVLEVDLANACAEVEHLTTRHIVDKVLLDGVRTAIAPHKTALQRRVAGDTNDRGKLLADKAAIDSELHKLQEGMQARIDSIQASSGDDLKQSNALYRERVNLLLSAESLKRQM